MTAAAIHTSDNALLVRDTAGLHVEIRWLPITETIVLHVEHGGETAARTVRPEQVRDAFDHPLFYLSDRQVEQLFPRTTAEH